MELRIFYSTFIVLLLMIMSIFGCAYMKGKIVVSPGTDRREDIMLEPAQRDQLLKEMRQLLQGVHGILTGLSGQEIDAQKVEESGRSVGMKMASDSDPAIMGKLPDLFKEMGVSVHRDFDELADAAKRGESEKQIMARLVSITSRCTTCHEIYRLTAKQ